MVVARGQPLDREPAAEIDRQQRRRRKCALVGTGYAGRRHVHDQPPAVTSLRTGRIRALDPAVYRDRTGPGVERELERPQREGVVDLGDGVNPGGGGRAEQGHLELAVLFQPEPVVGGQDLPDGEPDLGAAVVDTLPLRGGAIPGQIGRQVEGCLEIGPVHEDRHRRHPGDEHQHRHRPGHGAGQRSEPEEASARGYRFL